MSSLDTIAHRDATGNTIAIGAQTTADGKVVEATRPYEGTFGYAAGTAAATVDVPANARVTRVTLIAGASAGATVTIAAGATITIPAGYSFDEVLRGDAALGADVVIGGSVQSYYVAWVTP